MGRYALNTSPRKFVLTRISFLFFTSPPSPAVPESSYAFSTYRAAALHVRMHHWKRKNELCCDWFHGTSTTWAVVQRQTKTWTLSTTAVCNWNFVGIWKQNPTKKPRIQSHQKLQTLSIFAVWICNFVKKSYGGEFSDVNSQKIHGDLTQLQVEESADNSTRKNENQDKLYVGSKRGVVPRKASGRQACAQLKKEKRKWQNKTRLRSA